MMSWNKREHIAQLIPHQGKMCLWEEIVAWESNQIHLQSQTHRDKSHPLQEFGRLSSVVLCEYGAQATAVHGGLLARYIEKRSIRQGKLVALRDICIHVDFIEDLPGVIDGKACILASSEHSQSYMFSIWHQKKLLAEGRTTVHLETV